MHRFKATQNLLESKIGRNRKMKIFHSWCFWKQFFVCIVFIYLHQMHIQLFFRLQNCQKWHGKDYLCLTWIGKYCVCRFSTETGYKVVAIQKASLSSMAITLLLTILLWIIKTRFSLTIFLQVFVQITRNWVFQYFHGLLLCWLFPQCWPLCRSCQKFLSANVPGWEYQKVKLQQFTCQLGTVWA